MGRRTSAEKAESKGKILDAAADLIRVNGIEKTSVSDVMKRAGLTHGGFYRHFDSKEDLVAAAIPVAFRAGLDRFDDDQPGTRDQALEYIEQYLSEEHVVKPASGCPMPLLGAEVARGNEGWQDPFVEGLQTASRKLQEGLDLEGRNAALRLLCQLVGTLVVARAVGKGPLREELLTAARTGLSGVVGEQGHEGEDTSSPQAE